MKKTRFTESQFLKISKIQESGQEVSEICREHGISEFIFYNWKSKYASMSYSERHRVKELKAENSRLIKIVANQQLSIDVLKEINSKKW